MSKSDNLFNKFNNPIIKFCNIIDQDFNDGIKQDFSVIENIFNNKNIVIQKDKKDYLGMNMYLLDKQLKLNVNIVVAKNMFNVSHGCRIYKIKDINIFLDNVDISEEDGPWNEYIDNSFVPRIELCVKEIEIHINDVKRINLIKNNKDLEMVKKSFTKSIMGWFN